MIVPMKEYKCGYGDKCLFGCNVKADDAIKEGKAYFHPDCLKTKHEIADLRRMYFELIDDKADFRVVCKVLNDLVLRDGLDIDYIRFSLEYYGKYKVRLKSPLSLTYLRTNQLMMAKWKQSGRG